MFDVITFGSATNDIFLKLKPASQGNNEVCFPLGSKIFVEDLGFFSGGGGTNSACAFANQGFKTAYVGRVGDDPAGKMIMDDLKRFNVSAAFLQKDLKNRTAVSVVLSLDKERTILVYQGACHFMEKEDIPWQKIKKTRWFYIAPLYEKSAELLVFLVGFAKKNKIKVALNPGANHIKLGLETLKTVFSQIDVLLLNKEEAALLSGAPTSDETGIMKKLTSVCPGIIVVTKGREGSVVSDGKYIFEASASEVDIVEKTGAGDAFGSGFLAGLLQKNNIEYAIQLATANSVGCIQKMGAKNGLLKKDNKSWHKVKVIKKPFLYL